MTEPSNLTTLTLIACYFLTPFGICVGAAAINPPPAYADDDSTSSEKKWRKLGPTSVQVRFLAVDAEGEPLLVISDKFLCTERPKSTEPAPGVYSTEKRARYGDPAESAVQPGNSP